MAWLPLYLPKACSGSALEVTPLRAATAAKAVVSLEAATVEATRAEATMATTAKTVMAVTTLPALVSPMAVAAAAEAKALAAAPATTDMGGRALVAQAVRAAQAIQTAQAAALMAQVMTLAALEAIAAAVAETTPTAAEAAATTHPTTLARTATPLLAKEANSLALVAAMVSPLQGRAKLVGAAPAQEVAAGSPPEEMRSHPVAAPLRIVATHPRQTTTLLPLLMAAMTVLPLAATTALLPPTKARVDPARAAMVTSQALAGKTMSRPAVAAATAATTLAPVVDRLIQTTLRIAAAAIARRSVLSRFEARQDELRLFGVQCRSKYWRCRSTRWIAVASFGVRTYGIRRTGGQL